ncbi:MAG: NAD+ synthase [Bacteroidales bacterium]
MKVALAQYNFTVNHFEYNKLRIIEGIERAKESNADLVVFSELSVCGYPPLDLLDRKTFVDSCIDGVKEIATHCQGIAAVVGAPSYNQSPVGKMLYNSAYLLNNGEIESVHHKALLPTYDIFDEYRYFESNIDFHVVLLNGKRIAITVCEDMWDNQPPTAGVSRSNLYKISPMEELAKQNPELVINISASPFSKNSFKRRFEVFQDKCKQFKLPVVHVNQVGANTDLIFEGSSFAFNNDGKAICKLKDFSEDFQIVDIEGNDTIDIQPQKDSIAQIHDALVMGIRDYFHKSGLTKATLGLSGGIDSAVTLVLAQKALGSQNVRVLLMPSQYSSQHSIDDAVALAKNLNVQYHIVNISSTFDVLRGSMSDVFGDIPEDVTEENIQARIRGTMLMALSNKLGHLLLNTSNKSEAAVGYGTLYGDMCGAISVLGDVYKSEVFDLARYINKDQEVIPENTINKPPSAELRPDQKDSDSLPEYEVLDKILYHFIEGHKSAPEIVALGFEEAVVNRVLKLVNASEHKRIQSPPILRVSPKAFGHGRRIPVVAKFI